jgi:alpha-2-macroglobulin
VNLFLRELRRGRHSLRYRMRAEIPGKFSALPAAGTGMYAPELKANSDELKLGIEN